MTLNGGGLGGLQLGSPTGADKGTGTLNATNLYVNNVAVLTANQTITLSGDATGSGTTTIPVTLATVPVAKGGTNKTSWVAGSIPFAASTTALGESNANLFWDNTNLRLGIGTAAPVSNLTVHGGTNQNFVAGGGTTTQIGALNDAGSGWVSLHINPAANTYLCGTSGNVGVGTTTPAGKLTVSGAGQNVAGINTTTIGGSLVVDDTNGTGGSGGSIVFTASSQLWRFASIQGLAVNGGGNSQGDLSFSIRRVTTDPALTETARFAATGSCLNTSGSWSTFSDASIKSGVTPYERGLDAILALNPVSFRYTEASPFGADAAPRYGLIAQEVQPHVPEAVGSFTHHPMSEKAVELLTLDPGTLTYVLINAVKELKAEINALKAAG
jgi:hypothetical protein